MRVHGQLWAITIDRSMPPHYVLADDLEDAIRGMAIQLDQKDLGERVLKAECLTLGGITLSHRTWGTVTKMVLE